MSEQDEQVVLHEGGSNAGKWILLGLAVIYVAASLYFLIDMRGRIDKLGKDQTASQTEIADLNKRIQSAEAEAETLGHQLGITKKELTARAQDLQRSQRAAEERLAKEQKEQISAVSGEVAGVKTDVGGVKTDVASTKSELAAKEDTMDNSMGELVLESAVVAHTW